MRGFRFLKLKSVWFRLLLVWVVIRLFLGEVLVSLIFLLVIWSRSMVRLGVFWFFIMVLFFYECFLSWSKFGFRLVEKRSFSCSWYLL